MIVRQESRERYLIVSKTALEDPRLSWKARGLFAYLMTKPDGWDVTTSHLVQQAPEGKDAVLAGLRELEACGYLRRERVRTKGGAFTSQQSVIYEEPVAENPPPATTGLSSAGKPELDNPPLVNKEVSEEGSSEEPPTSETANAVSSAGPPAEDLTLALDVPGDAADVIRQRLASVVEDISGRVPDSLTGTKGDQWARVVRGHLASGWMTQAEWDRVISELDRLSPFLQRHLIRHDQVKKIWEEAVLASAPKRRAAGDANARRMDELRERARRSRLAWEEAQRNGGGSDTPGLLPSGDTTTMGER